MVTMTNERKIRLAKNTVDRYFSDISFQAQWGKGEEVKTSARKAAVKRAALVLLENAQETLAKASSAVAADVTPDFISLMQAAKEVARIADILRQVTGQRNQGCENHVEYHTSCIECHPESQSW